MVERNEFTLEFNLAQDELLAEVVDKLCRPASYDQVAHHTVMNTPTPSLHGLEEIIKTLRTILFPGYFSPMVLTPESLRHSVKAALDHVFPLLWEQVRRGFCFQCHEHDREGCAKCDDQAHEVTQSFLNRLPEVRARLAMDVNAAYEGDPAANSPDETIFSYPSIRFLTYFRIARELHLQGVPYLPRIITEIAHSQTGIDIHPGADLGERLFMDHGTGIVIGETAIVGRNVRIYQGVTLGAISFPLDEYGKPIKGIPRHPLVEDDVVIYAGATILGRITIGRGSVIGGNVWITKSVPPYTRVLQDKPKLIHYNQGTES
jgi:serine O-acetyltransferase